MQVNFSADEYEVLKYLADTQGKWPAQLVHDWMMDMAHAAAAKLLKAQEERRGARDGSGDHGTAIHPSTPIQTSREMHDGQS